MLRLLNAPSGSGIMRAHIRFQSAMALMPMCGAEKKAPGFSSRVKTLRYMANAIRLRMMNPVGCLLLSSILGGCAVTSSGVADAPLGGHFVEVAELPSLPASPNLASLIAYAQAHHPRVAAAEADWRAARANVVSAGALMDPALSVSQSLAGRDTQSVALQQRLPLFGQRGLAREQADHRAKGMAARRDQVRLEVTQNLVNAYAEYAYILAARQVLAEQEQLVQQLLQVVRVRYQAGAVQQGALLRVQNEVDSLAREQADLLELGQAAIASLNVALGRPITAAPPPVDLHAVYPVELPEDLFDRLLAANPALRMSTHEAAAERVGQRLADRAGLPDLMLGVEHMRDEAMAENKTSVMAGITIPIWRSNYRAQRERGAALHQASRHRLDDQRLQLQAELTMLQFRLQEAQRKEQLYGEVLQVRARQAFESTRTAYQGGEARFSDLVESQREWLAFQLGHARALADILMARGAIAALVDLDLTSNIAGGNDE